MDYTILRHALYAEIMVGDLEETLATGVLTMRRLPGASPEPCASFSTASPRTAAG
jgi:hypothetical protein